MFFANIGKENLQIYKIKINYICNMQIQKIYNENCLATMNNMPDYFIDFVITSPPYDDIRNYNVINLNLKK